MRQSPLTQHLAGRILIIANGKIVAQGSPEEIGGREAAPGTVSFAVPPGIEPEAVRRIEAWLGELPVATVYFWASIAGMPEDLVAAQIQAICTKLAPLLADQNPTPADTQH